MHKKIYGYNFKTEKFDKKQHYVPILCPTSSPPSRDCCKARLPFLLKLLLEHHSSPQSLKLVKKNVLIRMKRKFKNHFMIFNMFSMRTKFFFNAITLVCFMMTTFRDILIIFWSYFLSMSKLYIHTSGWCLLCYTFTILFY